MEQTSKIIPNCDLFLDRAWENVRLLRKMAALDSSLFYITEPLCALGMAILAVTDTHATAGARLPVLNMLP